MFVAKMIVLKSILLFVIMALVNLCCSSVDIESYLKTCDRNSPDVNECLVGAIQTGLMVMAPGIPELGVPPIDPYHQKELRVDYKNNQILVKMVMKNIYVMGLKDSTIRNTRLRADEDRFYLEVDVITPRVGVTGEYAAEGSYNSLQVKASGVFNTNMTDLLYTWKIEGTPGQRDNETYVRIQTFYMRPDLGNLKSYLSNDNPDTAELTRLGNNFANANWKILYRELLPYAQANWNKIGIRVANKIFQKVPYDRLFPADL